MKRTYKDLTRAEEEVMQVLWSLKKAFVKDILEQFDEPRPAYNTVSTIVRILEDKGFIGHKSFGKTHEYYPLISKSDYSRRLLSKLSKGYFLGSFKSLVSFLAEEKELSLRDVDEIKKILNSKKHDHE